MAETDDVEEVGRTNGDPSLPANIQKVEQLRGSASFIRNVVKTYGRQLAPEKYHKLNKLIELLESK